jgi:hypothetical protein
VRPGFRDFFTCALGQTCIDDRAFEESFWMMIWEGWEKKLFISLQQCHSNCLEWLCKTTQYLVKYINSPSRNSKHTPLSKLAIYCVCHFQYISMLFSSISRSYCFECQPYVPRHWRYSHTACECGPPCQTSSISCYHVYLSISEDVQISEPVPGNTVAAAPHSGRIRVP